MDWYSSCKNRRRRIRNLLLHLEDELHKRVIGQDDAVTAVAKAVRRARAGLKGSKTSNWFLLIPWTNRGW